MEHQQALPNVLYAVKVYSEMKNSESTEIISVFANEIGSEIDANKLYVFVPMAFGFALARRMGVEKFPSEFYVLFEN